MPYANNNGVKIYYEVEGQGPPLVLAHARSASGNSWRIRGYTDALRNDFHLILVDARGHSRSDKPHEAAAYGLKMADDVVAVLDDIDIDQAHYFGYSLGSKIGYWLASRYPRRFLSFILGGMTPYREADAVVRSSQDTAIQNLKVRRSEPQRYLSLREQQEGRSLTNEEKDGLLVNDEEALIALMTGNRNAQPLNNNDLSLISVPCLLYCGDLDRFHIGAEEAASHIPHGEFISLPGLNHPQAFARIDLVLPHVKKFLAEVNS